MRVRILALLFVLEVVLSIPRTARAQEPSHPIVVPRPVEARVSGRSDGFVFKSGVEVVWSDERATGGEPADPGIEQEARRVQRRLARGTGWDIPLRRGRIEGPAIYLAIDPERVDSQDEEAYALEVSPGAVEILANTPTGLARGAQTLRQLVPPRLETPPNSALSEEITLPALTIQDAPRFRWRGLHLDVGRHMFSVAEIEKLLDAMALLKLNVFHWHLTEDQGWRIEIRSHPRLTEVGAWRAASPVRGDRGRLDGTPYGGFYTQEEVREVVAYAANLHIDVLPEIELPGHSTAAIAAYPELGVPEFVADPPKVGTRWGVYPYTLSPSEETLRFYEDVFDEVMELFPFEFLHIGGDEAPKGQWKESATVQARMAELGLESEEELQAWFVAHFARYFAEHGRRLIGWDEIQEGGLPADTTMMVWRGWHRGVEAVRAGHDIVMAPTSHTYFDYYQGPPEREPEAIGGLLPLRRVYDFEPVSSDLDAAEAKHVLGGQGQLWTEYIPDAEQLEYMAFPRAIALAEVLWSPKDARDWAGFRTRLPMLLDRFDELGIGYRIPEPTLDVDAIVFEESVRYPFPRGRLAFRAEGEESFADLRLLSTDALYAKTTRRLEFAELRPGGRIGAVAQLVLVRAEPLPEDELAALRPGVFVRILDGARRTMPTAEEFAAAPAQRLPGDSLPIEKESARRFEGVLRIETPGTYTITLGSDDGSFLELCGELLLDNGGLHGHLERTARVVLPAGAFPFAISWFDAGGAASLTFQVLGPGPWRFEAPPEPR